MRVFTPSQMRAIDRAAFGGVPEVTLMQNAGARIAEVAQRYAPSGKIVAFAGRGNNGGDAFAALARLRQARECVVYADSAEKPSAARAEAQSRAAESGVQIRPFPHTMDDARGALEGCALALDGMLGTGARLPVPPEYAMAIAALNETHAPVLAIDVPSGIDSESGAVGNPVVRADVTVTLGALKIGTLLEPARSCSAALWIADIGLPAAAIESARAQYAALDDEEFLALLPRRAQDSDKRKAGAPLIVAGSQQFPGAAILCALGAARAGAGYVTVATPHDATTAVRMHLIEQVVVELVSADDILDVAKRCSAIGIGPGLGLDEGTGEIVREVVRRTELPIVADASALFHFAKNLEMLRDKRIVLTPHEGEFARLSGKGTIKPGERIERLRAFVDRTGVTMLLKGDATLMYDGTLMHVNTSGTPLLATAGTGDVLTGIIATLLSQGLTPVDAARAGAYWHGLAAKNAGARRPVGVIARDVADELGAAIPVPSQGTLRRIF